MFQWLRQQSFPAKLSILFGVNFLFGMSVELFAIKTRAYDIIMAKKTERRYELDQVVYGLRKDIEKWTEEDMKIDAWRKQQTPE